MLRASAWCLVATLTSCVLATQVSLTLASIDDLSFTDWSFDQLPHRNATENLVFETVHSLLQRWPNTRMRNGHTIVPGTIPKGTTLYHGTYYDEIPSGPDWVATDPEFSHLFCREEARFGSKGCWQLTLATTRPLKIVYFDGSSAVTIPSGTLDTQDLLVWGVSSPRRVLWEHPRIDDLCNWGKEYGVDGFVRMAIDFEVMLCDFASGVNVVSFLNLVPTFQSYAEFETLVWFEVVNAGSWHNRFPGETRVQLDLTGLVSFYDTDLAPTLVAVRAGQERWDHRVQGISSDDLSAAKARLADALTRPEGQFSGIDWPTLLNVIVDRYAGRLELTQHLLSLSVTDSKEILDLARKTQTQLRVMITPYVLLSATPADLSNKTDLDWAIPVFKLCATTHTSSMESLVPLMTPSERLILRAIRGTSREICRTVTKMWAAGVYAGLDPYLNTRESLDVDEAMTLRDAWAAELGRLMNWLDWSVRVKCNPACGMEEMCYLPTWPIGFPLSGIADIVSNDEQTGTPDPGSQVERWRNIYPALDDWIRPHPKCIRRFEPYEY